MRVLNRQDCLPIILLTILPSELVLLSAPFPVELREPHDDRLLEHEAPGQTIQFSHAGPRGSS